VIAGREAWGATLLRANLGAVYIAHGGYALSLGVDAMTAYMPRMGFPAAAARWLAWYLLVVHLVGGALILVGLWTRLAALLQVPIMLSAVFLLHFSQGFFLKVLTVPSADGTRQIAGGYEYALLVLVATLALALLGPGRLALDGVWARRRSEVT
jgi:putative oxidoreductase